MALLRAWIVSPGNDGFVGALFVLCHQAAQMFNDRGAVWKRLQSVAFRVG